MTRVDSNDKIHLPKPESVFDESHTFDTLYPVNIRLIRV